MSGEERPAPDPAHTVRIQTRIGDVPYIIAGVYFAWMAITVAINLFTFWRGRSGQGWSRR